MQLDGFLSRFSLRELLELSAVSLLNGTLEIDAPTGVHRIFFVGGTCVHATSPLSSGSAAIWPLFELADAPFHVVAGATPNEQTIADPLETIIAQGEATARQWAELRKAIPTLEIVPALTMPANAEHVRIFEEDWPVLSGVDGVRTIAEIAQHALLDPLDVCTGVLRLKERGLLTLSAQPRAVPQPAIPMVTPPVVEPVIVQPPVTPTSFFARLLSTTPELAQRQPAAAAKPAAPDQPATYDDILRLLQT